MKRVAAVDIGSNSTRLLITDGTRESIVTRLGEGVDATGRLGEAPMQTRPGRPRALQAS